MANPQPSSWALTVALATAYLLLTTGVGIVLLASDDQPAPAVAVLGDEPLPGQLPVERAAPTPRGPTSRPSSRSTTASSTPSPTSADTSAGTQTVPGPLGITAPAPADWSTRPCDNNAQCVQVDDHTGRRYLRLGAHRSYGATLMAARVPAEREFAPTRAGYTQLRHDSVQHRGHEAVDWEFEWDEAGQRRHVRALFWRVSGNDYWVYASAELERWPETQLIYDDMVRRATP